VIAALLWAAAPACADRFQVQVGDMPPVYMDDAAAHLQRLQAAPGLGVPPADLGIPPPPGAPAGGGGTGAPPDAPAGSTTLAPAPANVPVPPPAADLDAFLAPPAAGPSAAFRQLMATVYLTPDQLVQDGVWRWYLMQPGFLTMQERTGNAVMAYSMARGRAIAFGSLTRFNPAATSGIVRSDTGLGVRREPWGRGTGARVARRAAIRIIPPASGYWYRIAQPPGWVPGIFVEPN
jgi:hypothetical protein